MQTPAADRNWIALQGDLLGAAVLGVRNVLCLTGDDVTVGATSRKPSACSISIRMPSAPDRAAAAADHGLLLSGRKIKGAAAPFLGAAENPFAPPLEWRPQRLAKRSKAGANFIQTQYAMTSAVRTFMAQAGDLGLPAQALHPRWRGPLAVGECGGVHAQHVPGVCIPDSSSNGSKESTGAGAEEGIDICVEIIQQVREIAGVAGVHVMAYRQEELVAEIIEEAGLLPRPFRSDVPHAPHESVKSRAIRTPTRLAELNNRLA